MTTPTTAVAARLSISFNTMFAIIGLLLSAALFGLGNVLQKPLLAEADPWIVLATRAALAILFMLPFALSESRRKLTLRSVPLVGTFVMVVSFALGMGLHNLSGAYTSAINVGFLVNTFVIFMPLALFVTGQGWPVRNLVIASVTCFLGASLLSGGGMDSLSKGDFLALGAAAAYAAWILAVSTLDPARAPIASLVCLQWLPLAVLGTVMTPAPWSQMLDHIATNLAAYLILGCLTGGLAYLLAMKCQAHLSAICASIIYPMEGVFGLVLATILLGEQITLLASVGSALIFASVCAAGIFSHETDTPEKAK